MFPPVQSLHWVTLRHSTAGTQVPVQQPLHRRDLARWTLGRRLGAGHLAGVALVAGDAAPSHALGLADASPVALIDGAGRWAVHDVFVLGHARAITTIGVQLAVPCGNTFRLRAAARAASARASTAGRATTGRATAGRTTTGRPATSAAGAAAIEEPAVALPPLPPAPALPPSAMESFGDPVDSPQATSRNTQTYAKALFILHSLPRSASAASALLLCQRVSQSCHVSRPWIPQRNLWIGCFLTPKPGDGRPSLGDCSQEYGANADCSGRDGRVRGERSRCAVSARDLAASDA